jgi:hypothetical protein
MASYIETQKTQWRNIEMQMERIRILVDRSRDAGWSDALIDVEPDDVYQATDNRDYLK